MRIGIISQARMGSTRLPGKVLLLARGAPMLDFHIRRLQASGLPIYLATTTRPEDDALADYAQQHGLGCYRGDTDDVLSRYDETARHFGLDAVVRVTSDCPLIDGQLIGRAAAEYRAAADPRLYLSNGLQRTFPRGLDFEIFSAALLTQARRQATSAADREHVTPYLHQNRPGNVNRRAFTRPTDASRFRLTLDEPADYTLLRILLEDHNADQLDAEGLIALLERHPKLVAINAEVEQKKYDFKQ